MPGAHNTSKATSSAELREQQHRLQRAFWEFCVSYRSLLQTCEPALYSIVDRLILERRGRALGYRDRLTFTPSALLVDLDSSILSAEWGSPPAAETAIDSPFPSTLSWDNMVSPSPPTQAVVSKLPGNDRLPPPHPSDQGHESEEQQFYTAYTVMAYKGNEEEDNDDDDDVDDSLQHASAHSPSIASEPVQGAPLPRPQPELEVLSGLRVLIERLSVEKEPAEVESPGVSFSSKSNMERIEVLGGVHNHAETECIVKLDGMNVTIVFIPWRDQVLLTNLSPRPLRLTKRPDGTMLRILPARSATLDPAYWVLQNSSTNLGLQLRPCSYHLLLEEETKKRAAGEAPSSKAARTSAGHRRRHREGEAPELRPEETGKGVVRRVSTDEVGLLASSGVPEGHTLLVVCNATGKTECSLQRLSSWSVKRPHCVIFKAVWCRADLSELVIVKMHKPDGPGRDSMRNAVRHWKREVNAHRALQHKRIASLVGIDGRLLMLAVELKDSFDLGSRHWCHPRGSPEAFYFKGTIDDAYTICAHIADALGYLDRKGIAHNDIKALNILYSRDKGATLIDFGLGSAIKDAALETGGSPWYKDRALVGETVSTVSGDVFSLGIVMLYLVKGLPLPERQPGWQIYQAHQKDEKAIAAQTAWLSRVKTAKERLGTLLPGPVGSKEAKLRELIIKMLDKRAFRISARDLAKEIGQEE